VKYGGIALAALPTDLARGELRAETRYRLDETQE
jgi:hypothetical protein